MLGIKIKLVADDFKYTCFDYEYYDDEFTETELTFEVDASELVSVKSLPFITAILEFTS